MLLRPMVYANLVYLFLLRCYFSVMYADCFYLLGGFSVFSGVWERTWEGNDLYREMIESGVIKLGDKQVTQW
jgi:hypothetical protein